MRKLPDCAMPNFKPSAAPHTLCGPRAGHSAAIASACCSTLHAVGSSTLDAGCFHNAARRSALLPNLIHWHMGVEVKPNAKAVNLATEPLVQNQNNNSPGQLMASSSCFLPFQVLFWVTSSGLNSPAFLSTVNGLNNGSNESDSSRNTW